MARLVPSSAHLEFLQLIGSLSELAAVSVELKSVHSVVAVVTVVVVVVVSVVLAVSVVEEVVVVSHALILVHLLVDA